MLCPVTPPTTSPSISAASTPTDITNTDITIIGAGIVGLCCALALQREGLRVSLYDTNGAGNGASYGNAGLISTGSCIPIALPGMLWQVPRWLMDSDGPLALRPMYAPKAFPWLWQWLRATADNKVISASHALNALHAPALKRYADLLGPQPFAALIKQEGQLHIWSRSNKQGHSDRLVAQLREQHGVRTTVLDRSAIRASMPDIASHVQAGICFPAHANTISPQALTQALLKQFTDRGGMLLARQIQKIQLLSGSDNKRFRLWSNLGDTFAKRVVVAAGAHTNELLNPLGIRLPLESERGYHVELPNPGVHVPRPFIYKDRAIAVTPMQTGLRFAGTVEIAGLHHPPNPHRVESILRAARELFPQINTDGARSWFGHRPSTPDSVPVIDESTQWPGLFFACGHGHTGMTGAPMTGELIAQLATGKPSGIDARPYRLSRFS